MRKEFDNIPLFDQTDHDLLIKLMKQQGIIKRFCNKGTIVYEQGSECTGVDVVCSGKLSAYTLALNGSETIVFEFGPDSIIGANLLFGSQNLYPMNIYCTADSTLLHVTKSAIEELLKDFGFVMQFVKSLSLNSQGMNKKITMYTQKNLRENLVDYFEMLSARQQSNIITLPVTKKQLAYYMGVQRPSLFRELKRMKDEGMIDIENRKVTLRFCSEKL